MKYRKWSQNELSYIKHHYKDISDKKLAEKLTEITGENITGSMVRRQRRNFEMEKAQGRPKTDRKIL